jgi:hypothetical protein
MTRTAKHTEMETATVRLWFVVLELMGVTVGLQKVLVGLTVMEARVGLFRGDLVVGELVVGDTVVRGLVGLTGVIVWALLGLKLGESVVDEAMVEATVGLLLVVGVPIASGGIT